uniref:Calciumactivated potassium channel subunit alpha1 pu n=1 Tax=Albugo laibachii Nc14 TaxID=890382 RepID=F0W804_9STRA|nr:calciumactivated potassium channel subunit alpha1 pu [Albugo laibachii Nc14]|eukprot:CCA17257.1 calciumactivated potassium channel subunit alpha1 pu [Albugo laibachii Nc14]
MMHSAANASSNSTLYTEHTKHYGTISMTSPFHRSMMKEPISAHKAVGSAHGVVSSTPFRFLRGKRLRDRISRYLDHSTFGIVYDIVVAILSLLFSCSYILRTYQPPQSTLPPMQWSLEIICAASFIIAYTFRDIYLADHRIDSILSVFSLTALCITLPVLPASFLVPSHTLWIGASSWRFLYPVRFLHCYQSIKAVLARCHEYMAPVQQFAALCYLQLICIIACAAGILQIAETFDGGVNWDRNWTFFNAFFNSILMFVTIQVPPADNTLAKLFVGILVVVLIVIVPYQLAHVMDLRSTFSVYQAAKYKPSNRVRHVVLCGDLSTLRIDSFFHEVFHDDHDVVDVNVVVLSEEEPSSSLQALLMDPFYSKRTSFIQGSILDQQDAQRSSCGSASAIFILSQANTQTNEQDCDYRTLMRVLAAKRFGPRAPLYVQMHRSCNARLMEDLHVENALFYSELVLSLLAQNCVCPGFSTLIYNLTCSSNVNAPDSNVEAGSSPWISRYLHGASHELYCVKLPGAEDVGGMAFAQVSSLIFEKCGVIVFAIVPAGTRQSNILLNPGFSYTCVGHESAFAIAKDRRQADAVEAVAKGVSRAPAASSILTQAPIPNCLPRLLHRPSIVGKAGDTGPQRLEDVLVDDVETLQLQLDPITVCIVSNDAFPEHIHYFIGPLRVETLHPHRPIVLISSTMPNAEQYELFAHFPDVYFVHKNPFNVSSLRLGGIQRSHRVVLMSTHQEAFSESCESALLADAPCLALYRTVLSVVGQHKAGSIITELTNRSNVHYIAQSLVQEPHLDLPSKKRASGLGPLAPDFSVSPAFASGLTCSLSFCDNLMINQFFNPMINRILHEFVSAAWKCDGFTLEERIAEDSTTEEATPQSSLYATKAPKHLVGRSFEEMFQGLLLSEGMLVLGFFRYLRDGENASLGYVYTSPSPAELVTEDDLLYILSHRQPSWYWD